MLLQEMALSRKDWMQSVRKRLEGVVGEYAKLRYFRAYEMSDYWSNEITSLLSKVESYFDKRTTSSFDKVLAFREAFEDAKGCQDQVLSAKNQIVSNYLATPFQRKKFLEFFKNKTFDCDDLLYEVLEEFSPKLYEMIKR